VTIQGRPRSIFCTNRKRV